MTYQFTQDYVLEAGSARKSLSAQRVFFDSLWLFDLLACVIASVGTIVALSWAGKTPDQTFLEAALFGCLFGGAVVAYSLRMRRYERSQVLAPIRFSTVAEPIVRVWLVGAGFMLFLGFALQNTATYSRLSTGIIAIAALGTLIATRIVVTRAARAMAKQGGALNIRAVVIADDADTPTLVTKLQQTFAGVSLLRILPESALIPDDDAAPILMDRHYQDLVDQVRSGQVDQIIVVMTSGDATRTLALVNQLAALAVPVNVVVDQDLSVLLHNPINRIGGDTVIEYRPHRLDGLHGFAKQIFDYCFALAALIAASPLLLLIAFLIKATSPGPVLFKQRRHGLGHNVFQIYKFRTMTVCEDGDVVTQARRNDQRITRIGSILRRTSLDELPQFLNVLRGEMSVVGPRPHAVAHNREHSALLKDYAFRHNVKPGITGWAQVNGFRGETDTLDKMRQRVALDTDYIRNWSFWLDMKIVFMTIWAVIRPQNAY